MARFDSRERYSSNCRAKVECLLNGEYLVRDIVYEAKAISSGETKYYVEAAEAE